MMGLSQFPLLLGTNTVPTPLGTLCRLTILEHGHYGNLFIEVLVTVVQLISIFS